MLLTRRRVPLVLVGDAASWPLAVAARVGGAGRVGIALHGTDVGYGRRRGAKGWLYRRHLRLAGRLLGDTVAIANSAATAEAGRAAGLPPARVVPLATDIRGAPVSGAEADPDRLLFAGRLVRRKGLGWFVAEVLPRLPETTVLHVAGTVWDAAEGAALDHPRVRFLGPLGRDALVAQMRAALAVVVPNIAVETGEFEGFGLVATEAAAAGGLALAACRDGLIEAVRDGETGFLLPSGDAPAWAARIAELRAWDPARRAAFLTRAMAVAAEAYSWDRVAREVLGHLEGP